MELLPAFYVIGCPFFFIWEEKLAYCHPSPSCPTLQYGICWFPKQSLLNKERIDHTSFIHLFRKWVWNGIPSIVTIQSCNNDGLVPRNFCRLFLVSNLSFYLLLFSLYFWTLDMIKYFFSSVATWENECSHILLKSLEYTLLSSLCFLLYCFFLLLNFQSFPRKCSDISY